MPLARASFCPCPAGVRRRCGARVMALPWGARMVAGLAAATVVARSPGLLYNGLFDRDEAYLSVMGDVMRRGGTLYVDVIDRKPPLVPLAYDLVRGLSVDMRMVRLLCAVAVLVNGVLVSLMVRRLSGSSRAAFAGGVLAVLGTAWFLPSDAQAANFELWGLAPATAGVLAAVVARDKGRTAWRWFLLAGALVALAANAKQPYIAAGIPVAWEAVRAPFGRRRNVVAGGVGARARHPSDGPGGRPRPSVALGVGRQRRLPRRWPLHRPGPRRRPRADGRVPLLPPPAALRLLGGRHPPGAARPDGADLDGGLAGRRAPRPALLRALLPTGGAAARGADRCRPRHRAALGVAHGGRGGGDGHHGAAARRRWPTAPTSPTSPRSAATCSAPPRPDDRILVWGALPDVYVSAQRQPAGVFLHDGYLTGNWASRSTVLDASVIANEPYRDRWQLFLDDLAADPPELIIDAARPGTDWAGLPAEPLPARCGPERLLRAAGERRRPACVAARPLGLPHAVAG